MLYCMFVRKTYWKFHALWCWFFRSWCQRWVKLRFHEKCISCAPQTTWIWDDRICANFVFHLFHNRVHFKWGQCGFLIHFMIRRIFNPKYWRENLYTYWVMSTSVMYLDRTKYMDQISSHSTYQLIFIHMKLQSALFPGRYKRNCG